MGVQATMPIGAKISSTAVPVLSGAASFPSAGNVSIVTILAPADQHRLGEVQRRIRELVNYARDNRSLQTPANVAIVININAAKSAIREEALDASVVDGDIALLVSAGASDSTNILENAHLQLRDWMNENDRLVA